MKDDSKDHAKAISTARVTDTTWQQKCYKTVMRLEPSSFCFSSEFSAKMY